MEFRRVLFRSSMAAPQPVRHTLPGAAIDTHFAAGHAAGGAGQRPGKAIASPTRDMDGTALECRRGAIAGVAGDLDAAAAHGAPEIGAGLAFDDDPAGRHAVADAVEPSARTADLDEIGGARFDFEPVADRAAVVAEEERQALDVAGRQSREPLRDQPVERQP